MLVGDVVADEHRQATGIGRSLHKLGDGRTLAGFGGDELYFAYEGEEPPAADDGEDDCPFLTAGGAGIARAGVRLYPRGWLQQSCWQSAASQSQRVLRYGLWPVHPYLNPALARFVAPAQTPEELVDIGPLELRRLAAVSALP